MSDSTLYLYTSLTAGSSHIFTATARIETILKANRIPFKAIDVATDEQARKLWGRRSKGKKLPGLVKFNQVVGDLEQIEEWNEYGELRMQIDSVEDFDNFGTTSTSTPTTTESVPAASSTPTGETSAPKPKTSAIQIQSPPSKESHREDRIALALRQAGQEAASKAKDNAQAKAKVKAALSDQQPAAASTTSTSGADTSATEGSSAPVADVSPATSEEASTTTTAAAAAPSGRRRSVVPAAEMPECPQRPPLVLHEEAAESSANFRAENVETLGLIEHHRGSIVSIPSKEEKEQVTREVRESISGGGGQRQEALDALKEVNPLQKSEATETIEEDEQEETKQGSETVAEPEEKAKNEQGGEVTQKQDPKAAEQASTSVAD